jgi:hypothetical protein
MQPDLTCGGFCAGPAHTLVAASALVQSRGL